MRSRRTVLALLLGANLLLVAVPRWLDGPSEGRAAALPTWEELAKDDGVSSIGPSLRRIAAKADPGWLVRWVRNPHEFRPRTRMPNFMFDKESAIAVAAYLWTSTKAESEEWLASRPLPEGIDPTDDALVARGKELADSIGCRGCHGFAEGESPARLGETKDIAPNLGKIAEKTDPRWIYYWIKGPSGYSPDARMPSLRLTDEEAVAVELLDLLRAEDGIVTHVLARRSGNGPPERNRSRKPLPTAIRLLVVQYNVSAAE